MFSTSLKKAALRGLMLGGALALLAGVTSAQTAQVEGTIKLKAADGTKKPVAGALIDIYRTDVKGKYDVKTDKNGHYIRLGLPVQGTFLFIVSGPNCRPTYQPGVKISQVPIVDFDMDPGDGNTLTLEQVQAALKGGGGVPTGPAPSSADRAKADAAAKERDAKRKEDEALQAGFEAARTHFNAGVELSKATPPNQEGALAEFQQAAVIDPTKHEALRELHYKANASLSESHYQVGVAKFNAKDRDGAKPHFEAAIAAANTAIESASTVAANPALNNDLIIYCNIYVKNAMLLVEFYNAGNIVDNTVKIIDKAEALDPANKIKYEVQKANLFRVGGNSDPALGEKAVAAYKSVLAADPNNLDALYNLGLSLLGASEKEKIQESVNYLSDFVAKAPPTDKRVPDAKTTIEAIKTQFKIEAEKPAKRGRKP